MHELGIVIEILELLDEIKEEQGLKEIRSLTVEAGELCGILPDYFSECWKAARISSQFENTQLRLKILPAVAKCSCGNVYELNTCSRICPSCHKTEYEIIDGKGFNIKEIEAI